MYHEIGSAARKLGERQENLWQWVVLQPGPAHIADHTYDSHPSRTKSPVSELESFAYGILIVPKLPG
jgi:hypothetical protein